MPYTFSPSSLKLLDECERCFYLHQNFKVRRPYKPLPGILNALDQLFKERFDSYRDQGKVPPELSDLEQVTLFADKKQLEEWQDAKKRGLSWYDQEGNRLRGGPDYLAQRNGKLIVLDFKSRGGIIDPKKHPEYSRAQLDIYNLLLRKNGHPTEDTSYLMFYRPVTITDGSDLPVVSFAVERFPMQVSIENAEALFSRAVSLLKGRIPSRNKDCGYCKDVAVEATAFRSSMMGGRSGRPCV